MARDGRCLCDSDVRNKVCTIPRIRHRLSSTMLVIRCVQLRSKKSDKLEVLDPMRSAILGSFWLGMGVSLAMRLMALALYLGDVEVRTQLLEEEEFWRSYFKPHLRFVSRVRECSVPSATPQGVRTKRIALWVACCVQVSVCLYKGVTTSLGVREGMVLVRELPLLSHEELPFGGGTLLGMAAAGGRTTPIRLIASHGAALGTVLSRISPRAYHRSCCACPAWSAS